MKLSTYFVCPSESNKVMSFGGVFIIKKYKCVCFTCIHIWCAQTSEEDIGHIGGGIMNVCEPPFMCWKHTLGSLEKEEII